MTTQPTTPLPCISCDAPSTHRTTDDLAGYPVCDACDELPEYTDAEVCTDCYFAHHYGMTEHDGQWYAGESDTPADREPLARLAGHVTDNTMADDGDGITDFSMHRCDGCGSLLGGARYRLAIWPA